MAFPRFLQALFVAAMVLNSQVCGQITTPCTAPLTNMVTPCMNFLTNSSGNGTSPTAGCCNALKSLTSTGLDCVCLLLTASVPFQLPINRTLAASLPRACNMPGVPVQCKGAAGAPLPAPGPAAFAPNQAPSPAGSIIPGAVTPSLAPSSDIPTPPTDDSNTPAIRPALTPSAATTSTGLSPALILMALGALVMKY
uniref:Bifunctional inhibitor/plant lipid transfer protein/seed storage helical domain-containing protein n=1 Tax=Kalanchoe fedtschenkoi TaxID=63787 RepID=A0A7N0V800_KALFE